MLIGSLFSGIGALDLGLERAGHQILWQAEDDKAASSILARHWPSLANFGDVTQADWNTVERPDAICAGNPCPDFSQAGQRKGMAGEQGQLWFEVTRALRALRPRVVILENVPGIFTSPGLALDSGESALGVVLSDLASLGYVGSYTCLRASDFGACHRRERWFAIAYATSEGGWEESGGAPQHEATQNGSAAQTDYFFGGSGQGELRATTLAHALSVAGPPPRERYSRPRASALEGARGVAGEALHGTPGRLGSAADAIGDRLEGEGRPKQEEDGEAAYGATEWGLYWPAISRWEEILRRHAPRPTDADRRLRPEFVEWMLGLPEGWTAGVAKTNRLRGLGNSVQVQVAEHLGEQLWG